MKQPRRQNCCRQMLHSVQKATTKGVKKAISPANEWRCLWVCVSQGVRRCVCPPLPVGACVSPWVLARTWAQAEEQTKMFSCLGLSTDLSNLPHPLSPLFFGFVCACVCAKAFCLISYKQLKLRERRRKEKGISSPSLRLRQMFTNVAASAAGS